MKWLGQKQSFNNAVIGSPKHMSQPLAAHQHCFYLISCFLSHPFLVVCLSVQVISICAEDEGNQNDLRVQRSCPLPALRSYANTDKISDCGNALHLPMAFLQC